MNTQQLECFTTLAKTLNYAKTAEQLSLSQPAVSRQIQSLETELGAKLFNRTKYPSTSAIIHAFPNFPNPKIITNAPKRLPHEQYGSLFDCVLYFRRALTKA